MPLKGYKQTKEHKEKLKNNLSSFKNGYDDRRFQIVGIDTNNRIRNNHLKRYYGITHIEYEQILLKQDNRCAICGCYSDKQKRKFAVDHNHITKEVRGLLCSNCNTGIGSLKENKQIFENAMEYLGLNK